MKRRYLAMLLALNMAVGSLFVPTQISAALVQENTDETQTGQDELKEGDFSYVILEDGTVSIVGYTGKDKEVVIPETIAGKTVTVIGKDAFNFAYEIEKITIPKTIVTIGESAFVLCSIKEITVPGNVTSIGDQAFAYSEIEKIKIEEGVGSIGKEAFQNCTVLEEITIPGSVVSIGSRAFKGCLKLEKAVLEEGVTEIGDYAFLTCETLKEITVPKTVTAIGYMALSGSGDGKTVIKCHSGSYAEQYAKERLLNYTLLNNSNHSQSSVLESDGFKYLIQEDGTVSVIGYTGENEASVTIPKTIDGKKVTAVKGGGFSVEDLEEISFPDTVKSIGDRAFADCEALEKITFSKSLTSIGKGAFWGCTQLKEVNLPNTVTSIGDSAFGACYRLKKIVIPNGMTSIGNNVFEECSALAEVSIPNSVTDIGVRAFALCESLEKITIPNGVANIGDGAFYGCSSLKTILIADSVTTIGKNVFEDSNKVTIQCNEDSYAKEYAKKNDIKYQLLKETSHTHDYTSKVTKKATAKKNGTITKTCTDCGETKKTTIYRLSKATLSYESCTYNGKSRKPSVTVLDSKNKKVNEKYYTVSYKNNKNVGKATVAIEFKGRYSGTLTETFTIKPKNTSISKISAKSKGFSVKWKKQDSQTTGYQIQYSTSKKFTEKTTDKVTVSKNKTSKTISKLKASKKYYVRIRTYKTVKVNGKSTKIYSAWSKISTVTTKK